MLPTAERLDVEFKQITIPTTYLPRKVKIRLEEYILEGQWIGNRTIKKTVSSTLNNFLPKYISSWSHPDYPYENGKIYIGITDDGEIQGIPYYGKIDEQWIKLKIYRILAKKCHLSKIRKQHILKNIQINIIPVEPEVSWDLTAEISAIQQYNDTVTKEAYDFKYKYLEWHRKMILYSMKLIDIIIHPETKQEMVEFITYHTKKNLHLREYMLEQLKNNSLDTTLSYAEIQNRKKEPYDLYYWVCLFKDIKRIQHHRIKPHREYRRIIPFNSILMSPKGIINHWKSTYGSRITTSVIELVIPSLKPPITIKQNNEMVIYKRVINHNGPSSIPISPCD